MNARKDKSKISKDTHTLMRAKANEYDTQVSSVSLVFSISHFCHQNEKQEDAYAVLSRLKTEERDRQKKITDLEKQVAKLQQEKENPPQHEETKVVEEDLVRPATQIHPLLLTTKPDQVSREDDKNCSRPQQAPL
jgi:hypothetical protein